MIPSGLKEAVLLLLLCLIVLGLLLLPSLPASVVCHDSASKECRRKMGEAYALNQRVNGMVSEHDLKNLRRKFEENQTEEMNSRSVKLKRSR